MCFKCRTEHTRENLRTSYSLENRVCALYHEGFTVSLIAEVLYINPLTVAYIVEEYA